MNRPDVDQLAKRPRESAQALVVSLAELRSQGATILECIKYAKLNQGCSLEDAVNIVVNSSAWADRKTAFLQHQQDVFEEFLADNSNEIESIKQTVIPTGSTFVVSMKMPAGRSKGSVAPEPSPDDK